MENKVLLTVNSDKPTALIVLGIIFCITIVFLIIGIALLVLAFSRKETLTISTCSIQGEGRLKGNNIGTKVTSSNYVIPVSYISYISLRREKSLFKKAKGTIIIGCDSKTVYFGPTKKCDEIYRVLNELINKKHFVNTNNNESVENDTIKIDVDNTPIENTEELVEKTEINESSNVEIVNKIETNQQKINEKVANGEENE